MGLAETILAAPITHGDDGGAGHAARTMGERLEVAFNVWTKCHSSLHTAG